VANEPNIFQMLLVYFCTFSVHIGLEAWSSYKLLNLVSTMTFFENKTPEVVLELQDSGRGLPSSS